MGKKFCVNCKSEEVELAYYCKSVLNPSSECEGFKCEDCGHVWVEGVLKK